MSCKQGVRRLLREAAITVIEADVDDDHDGICCVEPDDAIATIDEFVGYACSVADQNNPEKDNAFAVGRPGFPGPGD